MADDTKGVELAVGYVSAHVDFGDGERDVVNQFKKIGEAADNAGKTAGTKLQSGITAGVVAAHSDVVSSLAKTGQEGGAKLSDGIVGGITAAAKTGSREAEKTGGVIGASLTKSVTDVARSGTSAAEKAGVVIGASVAKGVASGSSKVGEGVLAGLDNSKASQRGAEFGSLLGRAITSPLNATMALLDKISGAHISEIDKLQNKYRDLGASIASARGELALMEDANVHEANRDALGRSHFKNDSAASPGGFSAPYSQQAESIAEIAALEEEQKTVKAAIADAGKALTVAGAAHEATELGDHIKEAGDKAKEAAEKVADLGGAGGEAAEKLGGIVGTLAGLAADPVVAVTVAVLALAAAGATVLDSLYNIGEAWEDTFNKIATQTGATGEQLDALKENTKNIAGSLSLPLDQIGGDVATVSQQFGDSGDDLEKFATQVGNAQVLFGNFNLNQVGKGFNIFGVQGSGPQISELTNLAHAYQFTGTSIDQFAANVQNLGPIAQQFNLNYDQSLGILTSFEKAGLDSNKAVTALGRAQAILEKGNSKKGILGIADPTELNKSLVDTLAKAKALVAIGTDASKGQAKTLLESVFGKPTSGARGPVDDVLQALPKIDPENFTAPLDVVKGSLQDLSDRTTTVGQRWTETWNTMKVGLEPASDAVHSFVADNLKGLGDWVVGHKQEILNFFIEIGVAGIHMAASLADAFADALEAVGSLLLPLKNVSNSIGDLAQGLGATGTAKSFHDFATGVGTASDTLNGMGGGIRNFTDVNSPKLIAALEGAKNAGNDAKNGVAPAAGAVADLNAALKGIPGVVNSPKIEIPGLSVALQGVGDLSAKLRDLKGQTSGTDIATDPFGAELTPGSPLDRLARGAVTEGSPGINNPLYNLLFGGPQAVPSNSGSNGPAGAHHETGGPIDGVRRHVGDNQPIMAKVGEHMWTVDEVNAVGGHGVMRHMRSMARAGMLGYDSGGPVTPSQPLPGSWRMRRPENPRGGPSLRQPDGGAMITGLGGNFNPNMIIDTSTTSIAPPYDRNQLRFGDIVDPYSDTPAYKGDQSWPESHEQRLNPNGGLWGFDGGGAVGEAPDVAAAAYMNGVPYSNGARDDCSGMVGRVVNGTLGTNDALPTTSTMGQWLTAHGFVSGTGGPGMLSVGWYNHGSGTMQGHAAMTLSNGENAESGGSHGNFILGSGAAGADASEFDHHMYLPQLYGEGTGSGVTGGSGASGGSGGGAPSAAAVQTANDNVTKATGAVQVATQKLQEATDAPLGTTKDGKLSKGAQESHDKSVETAKAELDAANRDLDAANAKKTNLLDGGDNASVTSAQNAVTDAVNRRADAEARLNAVEADPKAKPSDLTKAQNDLAQATTKVSEAQQKLATAQAKPESKKDSKNDPIAALGGIGGDFLKDNLPPGFSDPTSWPVVASAANLLKDIGGVVKDPTAKALLGAGGSALGGDGGGVATSLSGLLKPFGSVAIGTPGDAPGQPDAVGDPGAPSGGGVDPSAFIPGLPTAGDPNAAGGDTNVDASHTSIVNGNPDEKTRSEANAQRMRDQRSKQKIPAVIGQQP